MFRKGFLLLLILSLLVIAGFYTQSTVATLVNSNTYPSANVISTSDGFKMYWRLLAGNGTNSIIEIAIIATGCASGWVGLGIDHDVSSGMSNVDTVMARFVRNISHYL